MKKIAVKLSGMMAAICMMLLCMDIPALAETPVVLYPDAQTASEGCTMLGIEGKYIVQIQEALDLINEIRKEACEEGVKSPSTGNPLTMADYVPIRWSADLEYIARIRAAEGSLTMDHVRTDGSSCFNLASPNGVRSWGEVIAWNWSETMTMGIRQWYGEKADWVNQTGRVTGHYTQMIDPNNKYVGLGTFCSDTSEYYNTTAGEYSSASGLNESRGSGVEHCIQLLEVSDAFLTNEYKIRRTDSSETIVKGDSSSLCLTTGMSIVDYWGNTLQTNGLIVPFVNWNTSSAAVASVSSSGVVMANNCGTAIITGTDAKDNAASIDYQVNHVEITDAAVNATCTKEGKTEGKHCKICNAITVEQKIVTAKGHTIVKDPAVNATYETTGLSAGTHCSVCKGTLTAQTVIPILQAKPGTTIKLSTGSYAIAADGKSAAYAGPADKKAAAIAVPSAIKINGKSCPVTSIGKKAFVGCRNLKKVTGGKNVKTIGEKAFYSCTSLTKVTIPSKVSSIGKQAFYNCKKLKYITIKTTKLTSKKVGAKAFAKTYAKAKVTVPKKKYSSYKTLLKSKGMSSKATYKKQ